MAIAASASMSRFSNVFSKTPAVIGMIHLHALPGTPRSSSSPSNIIKHAIREADIYADAGIDGLLIENMHDIPYLNRKIGPEITATMSVVAHEVKRRHPDLPCGIQVLAGANCEALAIAKAAGLQFIRAEGFVFAHVADEGIIDGEAGTLLRYRKAIDADDVLVFTDIKKKHSSHAITADIDLVGTAEAAEFFLADGLIITGTATGDPANPVDLSTVRKASNAPLLVGSGVDVANVEQYLRDANALIVGSHFKKEGKWMNEIEPVRVSTFMEKVRKWRARQG